LGYFRNTLASALTELCGRLGDENRLGGVVCRHFDKLDAVLEFDALKDFTQLISRPSIRSLVGK